MQTKMTQKLLKYVLQTNEYMKHTPKGHPTLDLLFVKGLT